MNCQGCLYATPIYDVNEDIPPHLLYEDVVWCSFLEEFVVQTQEECVYARR